MVATNSMATRSSLELMLDKLQQLEDQTKDIPPALPVRPVSRARLPLARRPLQLDSRSTNCEGSGSSFNLESKRTKKEDCTESFHEGDVAESDGVAASLAQSDLFHKVTQTESSENSKVAAERGIPKIQKCYRGHQVRCYYKELRRGIIDLQSFIRGENARRGYGYNRNTTLWSIVLIQKQTRNYIEHRLLQDHQSGIRGCLDRRRPGEIIHDPESDQTQVPHSVLVDLQKQVLRSEAKVREKIEENLGLKRQLEELEKKWKPYEERMKSMEKEWQDQFTYIQECLAAAKNNHNLNRDTITITTGTPNGRILDIQINSVYQQVDQRELVNGEDSHQELNCVELRPHEELRKLKDRFKAWKKEYRNKLRDAQSNLKKLGNSETAKSQKHWWGRLSN